MPRLNLPLLEIPENRIVTSPTNKGLTPSVNLTGLNLFKPFGEDIVDLGVLFTEKRYEVIGEKEQTSECSDKCPEGMYWDCSEGRCKAYSSYTATKIIDTYEVIFETGDGTKAYNIEGLRGSIDPYDFGYGPPQPWSRTTPTLEELFFINTTEQRCHDVSPSEEHLAHGAQPDAIALSTESLNSSSYELVVDNFGYEYNRCYVGSAWDYMNFSMNITIPGEEGHNGSNGIYKYTHRFSVTVKGNK